MVAGPEKLGGQAQRAYIGVGSNLDDPAVQIRTAVSSLRSLPQSRYIKDSGLYLSKAMQLPDDHSQQPDYYNAVVLIETSLEPMALLAALQAIELQQGRKRNGRWQSRTLDLDILLYGELLLDSEGLQIPHPGICDREFVLYPLQNIEQELDIPGHGKLSQCILKCPKNGLVYMGRIGALNEPD